MSGLDRYAIECEIGRGAMGVVYQAWDSTLDRAVALKELVFPPGLDAAARADMVVRFLREARAAARLQHPNVVQVFDVFSDGDRHFIAMELLSGAPLSDLLDRGPLTPQSAQVVLLQVLDAVQAAHDASIVHRDLKPENIYLLDDGRVKVTDFGIAKIIDSSASASATQIGTVLGTPGYMAPEQVQGLTVDCRADIFAVGVVGCEMYGGRNPFQANSPTATLYRIVNEAPAISPEAPPVVAAILLMALQKDPALRYQRAADMADSLRNGIAPAVTPSASTPYPNQGQTTSNTMAGHMPAGTYGVPSQSQATNKSWMYATVALGVIVVVGLFIFATSGNGTGGESNTPPTLTSENVVIPPEENTSTDVVLEPEPVVAPDTQAPNSGPITPFWGAFVAADADPAVAASMASKVEAAGYDALVLDTADYDSIGKPGQSIWVVCAGPYFSESEAQSAADGLKVSGYPTAYAKVVR